MDMDMFLAGWSIYDAAALAFFVLAWVGIGWWIEHPGTRRRSVSVLMIDYRHAWMREMLDREQRIFDAALLQNLRDGSAFFASTSLIALGGVLTLAGNPRPLQDLAAQLPNGANASLVYQTKLLLVVILLTSAFLRFVWANRLFGYFSVLLGAVPNRRDGPNADHRAYQAAFLNVRAAVNFNRGLRAVYFAIAALAWLLGPIGLGLAALATFWTLYEREFLSKPRRLLAEMPPAPPRTRARDLTCPTPRV